MAEPTLGPGFKPTRVIVDGDGLGASTDRAKYDYGIEWDVVFLRDDGWTLGAPRQFEAVAYRMWQKQWTHFTRGKSWVVIQKYGGPR